MKPAVRWSVRWSVRFEILAVVLLAVCSGQIDSIAANNDTPALRTLIDERLAPVGGSDVPRCSDGEFLRRASLDLTGMPPTADQAREFIADPAADKRARLIDRLIASPHHGRHLAATLDLMLMERRPYTHVTADQWQAWLFAAVRENKPWNMLVRELLLADGEDPATRPAARFLLDRGSEPHLLTRDIGRIFFGRDLQCAQCHDHPAIAEYLQADYHGLLAFVSAGYPQVIKTGDQEKTVVGEKAGQAVAFESVFEGIPHRTGARMPDAVAIQEPFWLPGEEYEVPPAENTKPVPKFSRRAQLAELATAGTNRAFNENIVNRLWAQMFGRGLVHPLDLHHADNPATDPELLSLLADRFAAMNFDIRAFLRELALTEAYGRSFDPPGDPLTLAERALAEIRSGEPELAAWEARAQASAETFSSALDAWYAAEAATIPVAAEVDTARSQYADAKQKLEETTAAAQAAQAALQTKSQAAAALEQAAAALQAAVQAIPGDGEIAEAAQKLLGKSTQATAEIPALSQAAEAATAAQQASAAAWEATQPALEAALAKLAPLAEALSAAEQQMLLARRASSADDEQVAALRRRLETAKRIAQLPEEQQAIAVARESVAGRARELAAAQAAVGQHAEWMSQAQQAEEVAAEALALAASQVSAARAEQDRQSAIAKSISAALVAAEAAQRAVPEDGLLAEVTVKLQQREALAQTQIGQSQLGVETALAAEKVSAESLATAQEQLQTATLEQAARAQALERATAALTAAEDEVAARASSFDQSLVSLTQRWARDFTVSSLRPLTPEQLCWSVFRVTGVYQNHWNVEAAEVDKTQPLSAEQQQDPALIAARQIELEQRTYDKLKGNENVFVSYYGAAAGQPQGDFFSTADQALFAANGASINAWVAPAGDNVTQRIIQATDPQLAAEELYLAVLTRLPTAEESAEVAAHLADREADRATAAQELVWALLNSAEFRFNH